MRPKTIVTNTTKLWISFFVFSTAAVFFLLLNIQPAIEAQAFDYQKEDIVRTTMLGAHDELFFTEPDTFNQRADNILLALQNPALVRQIRTYVDDELTFYTHERNRGSLEDTVSFNFPTHTLPIDQRLRIEISLNKPKSNLVAFYTMIFVFLLIKVACIAALINNFFRYVVRPIRHATDKIYNTPLAQDELNELEIPKNLSETLQSLYDAINSLQAQYRQKYSDLRTELRGIVEDERREFRINSTKLYQMLKSKEEIAERSATLARKNKEQLDRLYLAVTQVASRFLDRHNIIFDYANTVAPFRNSPAYLDMLSAHDEIVMYRGKIDVISQSQISDGIQVKNAEYAVTDLIAFTQQAASRSKLHHKMNGDILILLKPNQSLSEQNTEALFINADIKLLNLLISEAVSNVIQNSDERGITISIATEQANNNHYLYLAVAGYGPDIAPNTFKPASSYSTLPGDYLGLGVFCMREIVSAYAGRMASNKVKQSSIHQLLFKLPLLSYSKEVTHNPAPQVTCSKNLIIVDQHIPRRVITAKQLHDTNLSAEYYEHVDTIPDKIIINALVILFPSSTHEAHDQFSQIRQRLHKEDCKVLIFAPGPLSQQYPDYVNFFYDNVYCEQNLNVLHNITPYLEKQLNKQSSIKRALIINSSSQHRNQMARDLYENSMDYEIHTCGLEHEVESYAKVIKFDIIVLDCNMPDHQTQNSAFILRSSINASTPIISNGGTPSDYDAGTLDALDIKGMYMYEKLDYKQMLKQMDEHTSEAYKWLSPNFSTTKINETFKLTATKAHDIKIALGSIPGPEAMNKDNLRHLSMLLKEAHMVSASVVIDETILVINALRSEKEMNLRWEIIHMLVKKFLRDFDAN